MKKASELIGGANIWPSTVRVIVWWYLDWCTDCFTNNDTKIETQLPLLQWVPIIVQSISEPVKFTSPSSIVYTADPQLFEALGKFS